MLKQQALDLPVNSRYTFETFVKCDGNSTALEFSQKLADPSEPENLLYLYGPTGSGKTHLLHAIGGKLCGDSYNILSCRNLQIPINCNNTLLLVDDLEHIPDNPDLRNALWEAFNQHYTKGNILAFASRLPPREIPNIDEHLVSRLLWGLVAHLDVSDEHSRYMLILKLAQDRHILIPDDVISWLLSVLPRDVGSLVGASDALYRAALQQKSRISLRLAKELFYNKTLNI